MKQTEELYRQSTDFKRYVDRYCTKHNLSVSDALDHALVQEVAEEYNSSQDAEDKGYREHHE